MHESQVGKVRPYQMIPNKKHVKNIILATDFSIGNKWVDFLINSAILTYVLSFRKGSKSH